MSNDFERNEKGFIKLDIKELITWNEPNGEGCLVSDRISKEGFKVGYMYREEPSQTSPDSGWRFLAGNEEDEYMNNPDNVHIMALNTVCNYDNDIIPYLKSEIGTAYIRINNSKFELDDGTKNIFIDKQSNNKGE